MDPDERRRLLALILAQRLEINAIESALKAAGVLTEADIQEIRRQVSKTAEAWTQDANADILALIGMHAAPGATMLVPLSQEAKDELRREIDDQTPQR